MIYQQCFSPCQMRWELFRLFGETYIIKFSHGGRFLTTWQSTKTASRQKSALIQSLLRPKQKEVLARGLVWNPSRTGSNFQEGLNSKVEIMIMVHVLPRVCHVRVTITCMISCDIFAKCRGLHTLPDFTPTLSRLVEYRTASQGIYGLINIHSH